MNTQLREMFDDAADLDLPNGMATRAMDAARQRRRQRWVVGGSMLATAAVVLGVVVAVSDVRQDAQPRPTDVASIPDELPGLAELPVLEAGSIKAASVAYIVEGQLVLVDSDGGGAFRYPTGPPAQNGAGEDVPVRARDVALSPDGRTAVMTMDGYQTRLPSLGVIDLESAKESVVSDLYPVGSTGDVVAASPATYAWVSDSSAFYCVCTANRYVTKLHLISVEADSPQVTVPEETSSVAPFQVAVGASGVFAQESEREPWWAVSPPASSGPLNGHALALSPSDQTYLISQGSEFVIGQVGGEETFAAPLARQATVDSEYVVATDVDAAVDGFVAVVAIAKVGDNWDAPEDAINSLGAIFIGTDGAQQQLTTFPGGTSTASFAGDLLGAP